MKRHCEPDTSVLLATWAHTHFSRYSSYMRMRNFLVIFATFLLSCSTEQEQSNSNAGLEFYENGWIKSEIVSRSDSTERIAYYNRLDPTSFRFAIRKLEQQDFQSAFRSYKNQSFPYTLANTNYTP